MCNIRKFIDKFKNLHQDFINEFSKVRQDLTTQLNARNTQFINTFSNFRKDLKTKNNQFINEVSTRFEKFRNNFSEITDEMNVLGTKTIPRSDVGKKEGEASTD